MIRAVDTRTGVEDGRLVGLVTAHDLIGVILHLSELGGRPAA